MKEVLLSDTLDLPIGRCAYMTNPKFPTQRGRYGDSLPSGIFEILQRGSISRLRSNISSNSDEVKNYCNVFYHSSITGIQQMLMATDVALVEVPKHTALFRKWKETSYVDISRVANNKFHAHIGCDPEIFITAEDGSMVPAFDVLKSKEDSEGYPYWDGYQAEFAPNASECIDILTNRIQTQLHYIGVMCGKLGHKMTMQNTMAVPVEYLTTHKKEYVELGCKPASNAYDDIPLRPNGRETSTRWAGGHLHFTLTPTMNVINCVKELDKVLGVISVAVFRAYDTPTRRTYYGRAGEYRLTKYGMEYRVLSNAWLCHPAATHLMYEIARTVIGNVCCDEELKSDKFTWDITEEEARDCINNCDYVLADKLLARNDEAFTLLIRSMQALRNTNYDHPELYKKWKAIVTTGIHNFLRSPDELSLDWGLTKATKFRNHNMEACTHSLHSEGVLDSYDINTPDVYSMYNSVGHEHPNFDDIEDPFIEDEEFDDEEFDDEDDE